jgi:zinc transport system ATP-binding protein
MSADASQADTTAAPDLAARPLLEISDLTVRPGGVIVVSRLSMTVKRGSVHALVGTNGAGKTSVLWAILGLVPFTGRILAHWQGRGRIAYVPQHFHVDQTLPVTVSDFLALSRQQRPVCLGIAESTRARIARLLDHVGLNGFEQRPLAVLSGGELRRVLIANALDPLPELLILDEPAGGLDERAAKWLEETLVKLKGEMTVLMVSHDAEQVRRIADGVTTIAGSAG